MQASKTLQCLRDRRCYNDFFHSRTLRVYPQGGGIQEPSNLRVLICINYVYIISLRSPLRALARPAFRAIWLPSYKILKSIFL